MIFNSIGDLLWILLFLPLFLLCSIRLFPWLFRMMRSSEGKGELQTDPPAEKNTFQAVSTTLAATVGTGNIIGTAQAIAMGGPGAVFWMWVAAILGFSIKSAEIWLGQHEGRGAVGTVQAGLGHIPALFYAFLSAASSLFVGNMAQMNTVLSALSGPASGQTGLPRILLGMTLVCLLTIALNRDLLSVGKLCASLVPFMTLFFLSCCCLIVGQGKSAIIPSLQRIFQDALCPKAVFGALGGFTSRNALVWGLRRGAFSNEAGLGTAGTVHALVQDGNPRRQALCGILEISVDTLLLCTVSALTLLCSGVKIPFGSMPGAELWLHVYACAFPFPLSSMLLSICIFFFGISTILGCYVPGSICAGRIGISEKPYRIVYILCAVLGCFLPTDIIWRGADLLNVLMACPNLLSMLILCSGQNRECEQEKNNLEKQDSALAPGKRKV